MSHSKLPHTKENTSVTNIIPMESRRKRSSSGELFSFPSAPNDPDSDFDFGCFTRNDSPSLDPYKTSPADHLFFNGRLMPHAFPLQPSPTTTTTLTTSRTSSANGKHSSMWSRSNSTNSRSSSCSSARTSSSDSSERRLLYHNRYNSKASKLVSGQLYGDCYSHRWQYITAVPVLKREVSRRKNGEAAKKQGGHQEKRAVSKGRSMVCFRFLRLFLLACRQCHAMEPSRKLDSVA